MHHFILDLLFPPKCLSCKRYGERGTVLCEKCANGIVLHNTLFCGACRARIPDTQKICHKEFPYVLGAATEYHIKPVREVIHAVKFEFVKNGAGFLGEMLADYTESVSMPRADIIIPIPLGAKRKRERGFNQAELIAHTLSRRISIPVAASALLRTRNTKPQTEFSSHEERFKNIIGAFSVCDTRMVDGKHIVLVDDVTTSGATFFEAARTLRAAGAKKIYALAAAMA